MTKYRQRIWSTLLCGHIVAQELVEVESDFSIYPAGCDHETGEIFPVFSLTINCSDSQS
jgi:hypothetical protein